MKKTKRPKNWKSDPQLHAAFEEGGKAMGKAIYTNPEQEKYFWKLVGPLKLWPRWYLGAFASLWAAENPSAARLVRYHRRPGGRLS